MEITTFLKANFYEKKCDTKISNMQRRTDAVLIIIADPAFDSFSSLLGLYFSNNVVSKFPHEAQLIKIIEVLHRQSEV